MYPSIYLRAGVLLLIAAVLYIFSPQAGLVGNYPSVDATKVHNLTIIGRALEPKNQAITVKVNSHDILDVTTDEEGRLNLVSAKKNIFNPVFTNTTNTLTIPTDEATTFSIVFYPSSDPTLQVSGITLGTVKVVN